MIKKYNTPHYTPVTYDSLRDIFENKYGTLILCNDNRMFYGVLSCVRTCSDFEVMYFENYFKKYIWLKYDEIKSIIVLDNNYVPESGCKKLELVKANKVNLEKIIKLNPYFVIIKDGDMDLHIGIGIKNISTPSHFNLIMKIDEKEYFYINERIYWNDFISEEVEFYILTEVEFQMDKLFSSKTNSEYFIYYFNENMELSRKILEKLMDGGYTVLFRLKSEPRIVCGKIKWFSKDGDLLKLLVEYDKFFHDVKNICDFSIIK